MKKRDISLAFIILTIIVCTQSAIFAQPVAFPGAEGSGMYAAGGRGGDVYEVTNLNNSGTGSIVDAISSGNRTIVFRVSGTIELGDVILRPQSYTTIAGQTAPGDGICIKGRIYIGSVTDVIIRYIRVRVDDGAANSSGDAIDIASGHNIIIDHVSGSYARDETISCQDGSDKVTVQWCIMSEALTFEGHSYGSLIRGEYGEEKSYHHNLYAHNNGRNPRPGNYTSTSKDPEGLHFDFRNNVMYNWRGSQPGYNADDDTTSRYNFVGNVSITGPESNNTGLAFKEDAVDAYAYWAGNAYGSSYNNISVPADQWSLVRFNGFSEDEIAAYKARSYEIPMNYVTTTSASQALNDVIAKAGASFPTRDIIDSRIINDVINGTGSSIDSTDDQPEGAWPTLNSIPAPTDTDHDGMPDSWEETKGLNSNFGSDRNGYDLSTEFTNLEVYLSSLVVNTDDDTAPTPDPMTFAVAPYAINESSISMTAETATDDIAGVEYYFTCSTAGGHDSGWQSSENYTDTNLTPDTTYTYTVKARDTSISKNETSASGPESATTFADMTAPNPDPMTWEISPKALSSSAITMTATSASDISGVEYYFTNTTDSSHDSGWQDTPVYTDTDLDPAATYVYQVKARDKSTNKNETEWSTPVGALTLESVSVTPPVAYWPLNETSGLTIHTVSGSAELAGSLEGSTLPAWSAGRFGNCLAFAADGSRAYVPNYAAIDFADEDFSVSLWAIQPASWDGQYELLIKGTIGSGAFPGSGKRYELYRKNDAFRFAIDDDSDKSQVSVDSDIFCTGEWVHIVAVRDTSADQISLYADGVLVESADDITSDISQNEPLYLADGVFDNGSVDDVRIFDYALNQNQVTEIYNGTGVASYVCLGQIAADFDQNCLVDINDFEILENAWANTINITDLAEFALEWLLCNREPSDYCPE